MIGGWSGVFLGASRSTARAGGVNAPVNISADISMSSNISAHVSSRLEMGLGNLHGLGVAATGVVEAWGVVFGAVLEIFCREC